MDTDKAVHVIDVILKTRVSGTLQEFNPILEAWEKIQKELNRLKQMSEQGPPHELNAV